MNLYKIVITIPFDDVLREKHLFAHDTSEEEAKRRVKRKYRGWDIDAVHKIETPALLSSLLEN
jgi:hypothetical protein